MHGKKNLQQKTHYTETFLHMLVIVNKFLALHHKGTQQRCTK